MDAVAGLDVALGDGLLIVQLFSSVNKLDHGHVDAHGLLQRLLDLEDLVSGLEVELLVRSGQGLQTEIG